MADLTRRPERTPRRVREQRAYRLGVVGAGAGVVTVVGALLAILTPLSWSIPVLAAIVAVVCAVMFRSTVSG